MPPRAFCGVSGRGVGVRVGSVQENGGQSDPHPPRSLSAARGAGDMGACGAAETRGPHHGVAGRGVRAAQKAFRAPRTPSAWVRACRMPCALACAALRCRTGAACALSWGTCSSRPGGSPPACPGRPPQRRRTSSSPPSFGRHSLRSRRHATDRWGGLAPAQVVTDRTPADRAAGPGRW